MFHKTEALALRITPFSNTSNVVFWLTPANGRIATVFKGAQRPKSPFLGQYDLFYTCELLYYSRERNGMFIARECTPLVTRNSFRSDWKSAGFASYISDLLWNVSGYGGHSRQIYELYTKSLDFAAAEGVAPAVFLWFELHLLDMLGFRPRLDRCSSCGAPAASGVNVRVSASRGGIVCAKCSSVSRDAGDTSSVLKPDALAMLRNWQDQPSPRSASNTLCSRNHLIDFARIIGIFLAFHLDLDMSSRKVALDLVMQDNSKG